MHDAVLKRRNQKGAQKGAAGHASTPTGKYLNIGEEQINFLRCTTGFRAFGKRWSSEQCAYS